MQKAMLFLAPFLLFLTDAAAQKISLSQQEIQQIGARVFENECALKDENLITWNEGEDFLSLGIGHFIWHPANVKDSFEGSFIKFLEYAKNFGEQIPSWLDITPLPGCPWGSRDYFLSAQSDSRLTELREFVIRTKSLQAAFIVKRLEESLPLMLNIIPENRREKIASRFHRIASTPSGIYALADYVNFKGLGIAPTEKYQGKGWGLLQVLEGMKGKNEAPDVVREFARSANAVLEDRVRNSPSGRNEQKWLPGWKKRVNSYIKQEEAICLQE
ncbi:MAG: hypothetical protein PHV44_04385 [Candidatus Omnitrophica bacterium]|nr:hypothetical protein [Candidatus Omnitrophota bacterium]